MKLHHDQESFLVLLENLRSNTNYRLDILEKDYYVVLMLKELAEKQNKGTKAYFKGGTAVYKIFEKLNRFSEDIDITLDVSQLSSKTQKQKVLKDVSKNYLSLVFLSQEEPKESSRTSIFGYTSLFEVDTSDQLQRYGVVKVEVTTFTISEPVEAHRIVPLLYSFSDEETRTILENQYDVRPFEIQTISLPRIFIDKIFAFENRVRKNELLDAAKHAYDIYHLYHSKPIQEFINNKIELNRIIEIQMVEESKRHNSEIQNIHPNSFRYLNNPKDKKELETVFNQMQSIYVFNKHDVIEFNNIIETLGIISKLF